MAFLRDFSKNNLQFKNRLIYFVLVILLKFLFGNTVMRD